MSATIYYKISDMKCPHCGEEHSGSLYETEYNTDSGWNSEEFTCECGAVFDVNVDVDVTITMTKKPIIIDDSTGIPNVVGPNQIALPL